LPGGKHAIDTLHVYGFGQLRLEYRDAVVASFPTRHVEELFGYLLVNQQVHHNREKLMDMLWPRISASRARARFSTVLWRLRTSFSELGLPADSYLQVNRQSIAFNPAVGWEFDIGFFEAEVSRAAQCENEKEREAALRAAVNAYRAEPYEGLYANWCLRERERLARLYLRTMGQLMVLLMQRRAYQEALHFGHKILQDDPLREEVHRALMFCHWKLGDHRRALEQYEICARMLDEELQVMPMAQTASLKQLILTDRMRLTQRDLSPDDPRQDALREAYVSFEAAATRLQDLLRQAEAR
jgi:DNA-binding SARP family transcriptional activator